MSDKIIRFIFSNDVDTLFINLFNSCNFSRNYYAQVAGGTSSSMKNISRENIRNLLIAMPPITEQNRIVSMVNKLLIICNKLQTGIVSKKLTQQHLANAIVEKTLLS